MVDPRQFLKAALQFHGHKCEALVLGLKSGAAALNHLGVERSSEAQLLALVQLGEGEQGRCVADGVQMITGCTLGKGNVRLRGGGGLSLTLVDQATGRAVRVEAKAALSASPVREEAADALIRRLLNAPDARVVSVGEEFRWTPESPALPPSPEAERNEPELTGVKADARREA